MLHNFKENDYIKCQNILCFKKELSINKIYKIIKIENNYIYIKDNENKIAGFYYVLFCKAFNFKDKLKFVKELL